MACFHPLEAVRSSSGGLRVLGAVSTRDYQLTSGETFVVIPCGRCIGCRLVRSRSWAIRCMHEASMHDVNSFVTLTYDDDHFNPSLVYRDFQIFMYRLRRKCGPTRFFVCGEYGDITGRAHFHALLFGRTFRNPQTCGKDLFRSSELEALWTSGHSAFGSVTFQSASYVAKYCLKKKTGPLADRYYKYLDVETGELIDQEPEFAHMSLKPGIGYPWFVRYWRDVYVARDGVSLGGGRFAPPPRAYDRWLENIDGELKEVKDLERYLRSDRFVEDCSPERLAVRERCAKAREAFIKRRVL